MSSESNIHSELSIVPPPNIPPLPGHIRKLAKLNYEQLREVRFQYREQRYNLERRLLLARENLENCSNVRIKRGIVESLDEYSSTFRREEHEVEQMIGEVGSWIRYLNGLIDSKIKEIANSCADEKLKYIMD
jgi:hypothetical protein